VTRVERPAGELGLSMRGLQRLFAKELRAHRVMVPSRTVVVSDWYPR
jgi:hypothetical protein